MFKFGFDLPTENDKNVDEGEQKPSPAAEEEKVPSDKVEDASVSSGTNKPALTVLDISDVISKVFESDTLFEYVSLVRGESGESGDNTIKPLRRVVFPPDHKLPPSLCVDNSETTAIDQESLANTDLIPGVYEGGLKVWECSLDLCWHLANEISNLQSLSSNAPPAAEGNDVRYALSNTGKTLELGCGHGLPACLILRELRKRWDEKDNDATADNSYSVLFSDYNEFVLRDATIPNIVLNMDSERPCPNDANEWEKIHGHVGCVSGDWMDLSQKLQAESLEMPNSHDTSSSTSNTAIHVPTDCRFDLILAAETTYTEESAIDTARLLGKHLKLETGVGLIATKRFYFGVGGGADAFRLAAANVTAVDHKLLVETVKSFDAGVARDLLRVRLLPLSS